MTFLNLPWIEQCFGDQPSSCTLCKPGYVLDGTECKQNCSVGLFKNVDGICVQCTPHCESCVSQSLCRNCTKGFYLLNNACGQCHLSCASCSGPYSTNCLTCDSALFRELDAEKHACSCMSGRKDTGVRYCDLDQSSQSDDKIVISDKLFVGLVVAWPTTTVGFMVIQYFFLRSRFLKWRLTKTHPVKPPKKGRKKRKEQGKDMLSNQNLNPQKLQLSSADKKYYTSSVLLKDPRPNPVEPEKEAPTLRTHNDQSQRFGNTLDSNRAGNELLQDNQLKPPSANNNQGRAEEIALDQGNSYLDNSAVNLKMKQPINNQSNLSNFDRQFDKQFQELVSIRDQILTRNQARAQNEQGAQPHRSNSEAVSEELKSESLVDTNQDTKPVKFYQNQGFQEAINIIDDEFQYEQRGRT